MSDVYWRVSLGTTPEEKRERKQERTEGEAELHGANDRLSQFMGSSEVRMGLQRCPESNGDGAPALTSHRMGAVPGRGWPWLRQLPQVEAIPEA